MKVVPLEAFRDKVSFVVAVDAVERGFRALALGEAVLPDPMVVELPAERAEVHVKGAHLKGARHIVLKVATGFYENRARGLPSGDGLFLLLDAKTGVPAVLLEEHGYLTDFRTAAAVALTLKYLAPGNAHEALLVGAGALARLTARAMMAQLPLARLTLWNRTPERAGQLARELAQVVETRIAPALESAVRDSRVIVTATASTTPLIMASWVAPGTHVTSVGTGSPEKIELEPALLARADKLVADRVFQTERYGNLRHAVAAGAVTREKVYAELGDLATGRRPGRGDADEITGADLTGGGGQGASPAGRALGGRMGVGQGDEIALMQRGLNDRHEAVPGADGSHMMMPGMDSSMLMPGMLTAAQLERLDRARGREFDRLFLQYMIQHHQGAITMVNQLFASRGAGEEEPPFRFAANLFADQTTEIERMQRMLADFLLAAP